MLWKWKKALLERFNNSNTPNKLDGGDVANYIWKTKDEIRRTFFWPDVAQRLEEAPVPFEYFFVLGKNFCNRFQFWLQSSDHGNPYPLPLRYGVTRYVYELEGKEKEYDQIAWRNKDFSENHFDLGMKAALSDEPVPAWLKNNIFEYLDTDDKKQTVYNAYLFVRAAILTHQKEIEKKFGKLKSKDLNDYALLFA